MFSGNHHEEMKGMFLHFSLFMTEVIDRQNKKNPRGGERYLRLLIFNSGSFSSIHDLKVVEIQVGLW
jgi:hypothetical protein